MAVGRGIWLLTCIKSLSQNRQADFEIVDRLFTLVKGLVDSIKSDYPSKRFPRSVFLRPTQYKGSQAGTVPIIPVLLAIASP